MTPPADVNCPLLTSEDVRSALKTVLEETGHTRARKADWSAIVMLIVAFAGAVLYISKINAVDALGTRMDRFEVKLDRLIEKGMK